MIPTWFFPVVVSVGGVGVLLFIILCIVCCVQKRGCCCKPNSSDHPDTDDYEKVPMDEETKEFPVEVIDSLAGDSEDLDSDKKRLVSSDGEQESVYFGEPSLSQSLPNIRSGPSLSAYGDVASMPAVSAISLDARSIASSASIASTPFALDNCRIEFSMFYSKSDMFLMIKVDHVENILVERFTHYRVSLTLLPTKMYRVKTAYMQAYEGLIEYNESFKFSNVTRENLFMASFRMRLYGKTKMGRDKCLGECVVHLADVANRVGGFTTSRVFGPVKRGR